MTQTLLLKNARIIDGKGSAPTEGQSVLVKDGRFGEIGPEGSLLAPADGIEIDLSGKTLLPGFIDCHVHILGYPDPRLAPRRSNVPIRDDAYMKGRSLLYAVNACHKTLEAGFTTIRDLGAAQMKSSRCATASQPASTLAHVCSRRGKALRTPVGTVPSTATIWLMLPMAPTRY